MPCPRRRRNRCHCPVLWRVGHGYRHGQQIRPAGEVGTRAAKVREWRLLVHARRIDVAVRVHACFAGQRRCGTAAGSLVRCQPDHVHARLRAPAALRTTRTDNPTPRIRRRYRLPPAASEIQGDHRPLQPTRRLQCADRQSAATGRWHPSLDQGTARRCGTAQLPPAWRTARHGGSTTARPVHGRRVGRSRRRRHHARARGHRSATAESQPKARGKPASHGPTVSIAGSHRGACPHRATGGRAPSSLPRSIGVHRGDRRGWDHRRPNPAPPQEEPAVEGATLVFRQPRERKLSLSARRARPNTWTAGPAAFMTSGAMPEARRELQATQTHSYPA